MGMFDREPTLTSQDWSQGEAFRIIEGHYIGVVGSAKFGENQKARVKVARPDGDAWFVVFGVLADQIGRVDNGDLPTDVRIEKDGDANTFVRAADVRTA